MLQVLLLFVSSLLPVDSTTQTGKNAQPQKQSEPSYGETVRFINERLLGGLEETSHCHFRLGVRFFTMVDLSPHIGWQSCRKSTGACEERGDLKGTINCVGGKNCVEDSSPVNHSGGYVQWNNVNFYVIEAADQSKMERAFRHLFEVCGARTAKPDLF